MFSRIPILDAVARKSREHMFPEYRTSAFINPFPIVYDTQSMVQGVKVGHMFSINPRFRPANKQKPLWIGRQYQERKRKRDYSMRQVKQRRE